MIEEFWSWIRAPNGRKVGYKLLVNWWLLFDAIVASLLTFGLRINGFEFAEKALFPAASILMGMAVAWTARAFIIVNNLDFRENIISEDNPVEDYVYGYQMSILIMFICIGYIAIMASGGFKISLFDPKISLISSSFFMFFIISVSVRECWSIINFTSLLAILDCKVKRSDS